jgi:hypothetical protein
MYFTQGLLPTQKQDKDTKKTPQTIQEMEA